MSERLTYLAIDLGSLAIPLAFSFHSRIAFHRQWRAFFAANAVTLALFVLWDAIFTHAGVWSFNPRYVLGIYIFNLPLEELLFFICIPYAALFTYWTISKAVGEVRSPALRTFVAVAGIAIVIVGALNLSRAYTSACFLLAGCCLIAVAWSKRNTWLAAFLIMYALILVPFLAVNGLLTGTGLSEPVVIYNDHENTGCRVLTIPAEDFVYALLLLLTNTWLFERSRHIFNG